MVRKEIVTAGRGAQILKIPIYDFIQLMADHGMDWYDQSKGELDAELKLLREL
jgi:predicted HTH domain antitoxin